MTLKISCHLILIFGLAANHVRALDSQPVLSLSLAREAAQAAIGACVAMGYHATVVIVNADGVQRVVLRGDAAGVHGLDSAFRKAYTAAIIGESTAQLQSLVASAPDAAGLRDLKKILLTGGGIPIKVKDVVIGAIGAAGAPGAGLDEACASWSRPNRKAT